MLGFATPIDTENASKNGVCVDIAVPILAKVRKALGVVS